MEPTVFIYALNDPDTGETRYVGKTKNLSKRFHEHLAGPRREKTHKASWIRALITRGQTPVLELLDEVLVSEWPQWEVAWISFYREQGFDLTNGHAGGEGGHNPTPETRRKMSIALKGKIRSEETRARMSLAQKGKFVSLETCAKISVSKKGIDPTSNRLKCYTPEAIEKNRAAWTEERKEKLRRSNQERVWTEELRAKASASHIGHSAHNKGVPMSEEQKAKQSATMTGRTLSEEHRAKISEGGLRRWAKVKALKEAA